MKKYLLLLILFCSKDKDTKVKEINNTSFDIEIIVKGLQQNDSATVILMPSNTDSSTIYSKEVNDKNNVAKFSEIEKGEYYLKFSVVGYKVSNKIIKFNGESISEEVNFEKLDDSVFQYHWHITEGLETQYSSDINKIDISISNSKLNNTNQVIDSSALSTLYNIELVDNEEKWNQEYAVRLKKTFESLIPDNKIELQNSRWYLTSEEIQNDIKISIENNIKNITINKNAFQYAYADQKIKSIEGIKGYFFSKRLHKAVIRFITNNGNDIDKIETIFQERFGCQIRNINYSTLTSNTTKEGSSSFQEFSPNELITIINTFEEMPEGFKKINNLKYLVRRRSGMDHPYNPEAPAVAWPETGNYIEFMDLAFSADIDHIHRLIIHEKVHFMWQNSNIMSEELKNEWIEIGGWSKDSSKNPPTWTTSKQVEFVSAYSHSKNPDEDLAESISYYVLNPTKLKSRSINKYNFIKEKIMHSSIFYITKIRDDLQFEVLNDLFPDIAREYPGKIISIDINIKGKPTENKIANIKLRVSPQSTRIKQAYTRIMNKNNNYIDVYFLPNENDNTLLEAKEILIDKNAKQGNWFVTQIAIEDYKGYKRLHGPKDFGWNFFINNTNQDENAPKYISNSLEVKKTSITEESNVLGKVQIQNLEATWNITEDTAEMNDTNSVYARLINLNQKQYQLESYGTVVKSGIDSSNNIKFKAHVNFPLSQYFPSGKYCIVHLMMIDKALNKRTYEFADKDINDKQCYQHNSRSEDTQAPIVDIGINKISVSAQPVDSNRLNGETNVIIKYYAYDDKSGLGKVQYRLLDPNGTSHFYYHQHENFDTIVFKGDPRERKHYEIKLKLPKGSPPGTWGLQNIEVFDKVGNRNSYDFTEQIQFIVQSE